MKSVIFRLHGLPRAPFVAVDECCEWESPASGRHAKHSSPHGIPRAPLQERQTGPKLSQSPTFFDHIDRCGDNPAGVTKSMPIRAAFFWLDSRAVEPGSAEQSDTTLSYAASPLGLTPAKSLNILSLRSRDPEWFGLKPWHAAVAIT